MEYVANRQEEERYLKLQQMALDFARSGEKGELEKMLTAGMPVNLSDEKGNTLLMLAAYNGNTETSRLLINMGADVDRRNDRGQTPLGGVAFKGFTDIAKLLVDVGADIHADNGRGMKPVHFAMMFGRNEVQKLLEMYEEANRAKQGSPFRVLPMIARYVGALRKFFMGISRKRR